MIYKEVTEKIIGCAYRVYNNMGFGFLESVYEKCLLIELKKAGLPRRDGFAKRTSTTACYSIL